MNLQYNTEEEYRAISLEKAPELYGHLIVSAGLEAEIPPDEIGLLFSGVVENDEEWVDFKASFGDKLRAGETIEIRIGETQYFFETFID